MTNPPPCPECHDHSRVVPKSTYENETDFWCSTCKYYFSTKPPQPPFPKNQPKACPQCNSPLIDGPTYVKTKNIPKDFMDEWWSYTCRSCKHEFHQSTSSTTLKDLDTILEQTNEPTNPPPPNVLGTVCCPCCNAPLRISIDSVSGTQATGTLCPPKSQPKDWPVL